MTDRKFDNENDKSFVKMLWQKWIPHELYCYIYTKNKYLILTKPQIIFPKANLIIKDFITHNNKHLDLVKGYLTENANIYRHLYATLDLKFYSCSNEFNAENRSLFDFSYREWINIKNNQPTAASTTVSSIAAATTISAKKIKTVKNPENYKRLPSTINWFEQVWLAYNKYWFISKKKKK